MATKTRVCTWEDCGTKVYATALCRNHYEAKRRGTLGVVKDPKPFVKCSFEECDREASCKGFCKTHYLQNHLGKPLTPIRSWKTETHGDRRKCRTCEQWKDLNNDFYRATNGGRQGECKDCQIKRNRANNIKKELKAKGVLVG